MADEPDGFLILEQYPDTFLSAIGGLIVTCGASETGLAFQVLRIASHPNQLAPQAIAVVAGMDLKIKLTLIRVMVSVRFPDEAVAIGALCDAIQEAFKRRNDLAHNISEMTDSIAETVTIRPLHLTRRGAIREIAPLDAKTVRSYTVDVWSAVRALDEKITLLGYAPISKLT